MPVQQFERTKSWTASRDKQGWMPDDVDLEELTFRWSAEQVAALKSLTAGLVARGIDFKGVTRDNFRHPALDDFIDGAVISSRQGPGMVFFRDLPVEKFTVDELRIAFTGIGSYFGELLTQSRHGDLMGEVTEQKDRVASQRGYVVAKALPLHTDHSETAGLFCVEDAASGGENMFVSSITLYDVIKREHPEYIPILERGFRMWLFDEQRLGRPPVTQHDVPVFSRKDGVFSCFMSIETAIPTADALSLPLSEIEKDAALFVLEARQRPELGLKAGLGRGDCVFFNNFEVLHSRMPFDAHEGRPRHLLRLWLQEKGGDERPMVDAVPLYRFQNPSGLQGIDGAEPEEVRMMNEAAKNPVSAHVMRALGNI